MFRVGESGQWAFVDRRKDVLADEARTSRPSTWSVSFWPFQVSARLAVVAAPSDFGEDEIKAVVVMDGGCAFDHVAALRELYRRMPHFMVPRYYETVAELPKTHSMRVQKAALRAAGLSTSVWGCEAAGFRVTRSALVEPETHGD